MGRSRGVLFVVVLCVVLLPSAVWAQSSIAGVVRDASGAVLPGVTVEAASPALIEKVRVGVTDGQGVYRIVDLRPGPYTVTFTLTGFNTFRRTGRAPRGVHRNGRRRAPARDRGRDDYGDGRGAARRYAQRTRADAIHGGNAAGAAGVRTAVHSDFCDAGRGHEQRGRPRAGPERPIADAVLDSRRTERPAGVDGMNTEMAPSNTGVFVWSQVNFQEVVAETSGIGADRDTGGMQLNMIPRDGGNTFSGIAQLRVLRPGPGEQQPQRRADRPGAQRPGAGAAPIKKFYDISGGIGGPIKENKLWFFGSARKSVTQQYAAGIYWNKHEQPAEHALRARS